MESRLSWILLVLVAALRSPAANAKNEEAQAVSFTPANAQDTKMFTDFTVMQTAFHTNILASNVSLRFRTWQSDGLVFYCHDERRNFLQLYLVSGRFFFKYNNGDNVFDFKSRQYVNDGKWHNLHIGTKLVNLDGKYSLILDYRTELPASSYVATTTLRPRENIRLLRPPKLIYNPKGEPMNPVTVFLGGVAPGMGQLAPFIGCMADFGLGAFRANLAEAVGPNPKRVVRGCRPGCAKDVCQNGGRCVERWNGKYHCYCWGNAFVGSRCDKSVSTALSGAGGVVLKFPLARSVAVIGGKFGLVVPPRPDDLILHIDGAQIDVAVTSGPSQEIFLMVRSRTSPVIEYRISASLANLQPPFLVRFWLLSNANRIQLQLNDRQPVQGKWVLPTVRAEGVNIGDPTLINRRAPEKDAFRHFKGCLYNLQIFVKGFDYPIELSNPETLTDRAISGQCPSFMKRTPDQEEISQQDMYNTTEVGGVTEDSDDLKWLWYRIVLGICGAMLICLFIVAFIYTYHSCAKRCRKQKPQKGAYSQIGNAHASTTERPNGITRLKPSPTASPQHSVASTQLTSTPYKVPYRPPYVATSLVIRDGKHMAHIDSDVDLAESESELQ